jgi:hypothetical protein
MNQKLKALTKLLASKKLVLVLFIVGLTLFTVNVANAVIYKEYNSDDVSQQVVLKNLSLEHGSSPHTIYLGSDNYILKFPFYALVDHWLYGTRRALDIESLSLAIAGYALFFWSAYWLVKKFSANKETNYGWQMLPILWVSCLGIFFYTMFDDPNLRNIEIGLDFAFLVFLLSRFFFVDKSKWANNRWLKILQSLIAIIVIGFYFYSDPYSWYVFFIPLLILIAVWYLWKGRRSSYLNLLIILIGSYVMITLWRKLFLHFGLDSPSTSSIAQLAPLKTISANFSLTVHGVSNVFNTDYSGWPIIDQLMKVIELLFLIGVVLLHFNKGVLKSLKTNFLHQLLVLQVFFTLAVFTFSTRAVNLSYTRYFVIIPFCMALIGIFAISSYTRSKFSNRFLMIGLSLLLLISVIQNFLLFTDKNTDPSNVYSQPVPLEPEELSTANYSNRLNIEIAHIAEINGLKKGYADYWSALINTYFADGKVQFLPLYCGPGNKLAPYNWSLDTRTLHLPATTSFYLYDSSADISSSNLWCGSPPHFLSQLGQPTKIIPVTAGISFYVYNYDILHAMNDSDTKDAASQ